MYKRRERRESDQTHEQRRQQETEARQMAIQTPQQRRRSALEARRDRPDTGKNGVLDEDPLKITPSIGAEAKITGVARRMTPDGQRRGEGNSNSKDDHQPRRPEASLEKKPVVKSATLAIADEHTHFASMLTRRLERYGADDEPDAGHPANRFASNNSNHGAGGSDRFGFESSSAAGSHDSKQTGSGKAVPANGQSAIPSFSSSDAWLRRTGPQEAAPPETHRRDSRGSRRASTSSTHSSDAPSHTTHAHRRQPGREGTTPRRGSNQRVLVPPLNQGGSPYSSEGTQRLGGSARAIVPPAESCMQALAAIERSDRPRCFS